MNKRQQMASFSRLKSSKTFYLLLLAIISGLISLFALRANNERMVSLRTAVFQADQQNGDVQTALKNLQAYVTTHMNTDLAAGADAVYPPIQLKYTYERLVQNQQLQVQATNGQLYTDAQHYCEQQNSHDFSGHNRVPCIEAYVTSHGATITPIPDSLYKFDFVSPKWSPDLAGWSLLVAGLSFLGAAIAFISGRLIAIAT
ncbi:MAG TPA: hypothetical protein VNE40_03130 [Candidatus Dormibacteraeota bacterium]|nr:hypothetical protein [Candidatus Dormibacteraeota bacterium]